MEGDVAGEAGKIQEPWRVPLLDFLFGGLEAIDK